MTSTMPAPDHIEPRRYGLHFEDLPIGYRFRSVGRTITETDLVNFVNLSGISNEMFTNIEYAASKSILPGKRPAPAALAYVLCEGFGSQGALHGTGMAMLSVAMDVVSPLFVNDTIYCDSEVIEARECSVPGVGIVRFENTVRKNEGTVIIKYKPLRMIKRRAAARAG